MSIKNSLSLQERLRVRAVEGEKEAKKLEKKVASLARQGEQDQVEIGELRRRAADLEEQKAALDREAVRRSEA